MQYAMFNLIRDIRRRAPDELAKILYTRLVDKDQERFTTNDRFGLTQQNRSLVHLILARMTDYVQSALTGRSQYLEHTSSKGKYRYEVEHIWADKFERHTHEFTNAADFAQYRNRIGNLLLLPKSFNASYGALPFYPTSCGRTSPAGPCKKIVTLWVNALASGLTSMTGIRRERARLGRPAEG
jgi:hypothetical protein